MRFDFSNRTSLSNKLLLFVQQKNPRIYLLPIYLIILGESINPAGELSNPSSDTVSKPGEEVTSNFVNTDSATQTGNGVGGYHIEDLDPQPQHLVEDILNEKPLLSKLQHDTDQEYIANNQGTLLPPQTAADMYLNHNNMNSELVEPAKYSLESIKRSRIAHKLINLINNRTSNDLLTPRVRSIKRDIANNNNNVFNKKAKVKLKRALLKHLKKMSHKSVKK